MAETLAVGATLSAARPSRAHESATADNKFKLKYAPHFGMFKNLAGKDVVDQVKFIADQGFSAIEDNEMMQRPVEEQERIAKEMTRLDLEMGVFVATNAREATFVTGKEEHREKALADMRNSVECAKRVNARWCTVIPGSSDTGMEWDYQTANVIEMLKRCAEVCEGTQLTMVLEPLNPWKIRFLTKIPQTYMICKSVDSPHCKILFDMYHQQITEGNIIPNIDKAWSEIAYFQVGDNPGRNEPTTGEMNYQNIFKHLHEKGCEMIIGMEHGNSMPGVEGEQAVIDAYRVSDDF